MVVNTCCSTGNANMSCKGRRIGQRKKGAGGWAGALRANLGAHSSCPLESPKFSLVSSWSSCGVCLLRVPGPGSPSQAGSPHPQPQPSPAPTQVLLPLQTALHFSAYRHAVEQALRAVVEEAQVGVQEDARDDGAGHVRRLVAGAKEQRHLRRKVGVVGLCVVVGGGG